MKNLITILICVLASTMAFSQAFKPVKPINGQPGKKELPTPNIQTLKPDLEIPLINLFSATKNMATGEYIITVSVTIKNNGINAGPSKLHLDFQRESTHGFYFASAKNLVDIPAIAGGSSLLGTYSFRINLSDLGAGTYSLPVKAVADWGNAIAETNEQNNISRPLTITVSL